MLSTFTNLFSTMQNAQRKNSKDVLVRHTRWTQSLMNVFLDQGLILGYSREAVSYTHLTLPTSHLV